MNSPSRLFKASFPLLFIDCQVTREVDLASLPGDQESIGCLLETESAVTAALFLGKTEEGKNAAMLVD